MNSSFARRSKISESSAQRVGWGMGPAAFSRAKREKKEGQKRKNKAGKDALTDGAPNPL